MLSILMPLLLTGTAMAEAARTIELLKPKLSGDISLEQLLQKRRSVREYRPESLVLTELSQLLWAAQGITDRRGYRTAPSAGALYPLELYVVSGDIRSLPRGIYQYSVKKHELRPVLQQDVRKALARAALHQSCVRDAAMVVVIAAVYDRTTSKYGRRGRRYVFMEAGHVAQNLYLQAEALGLGTVTVGAFDDNRVAAVLNLPENVAPLMLMPFGRK